MSLRRIPAPDLLRVTIKQPIQELPPAGHCYISFRAGLLNKRDGKLTADRRKGQVAIMRSAEGFLSLQWYERICPDRSSQESFTLAEDAELDMILEERGVVFEWFKKDKRTIKAAFKLVRPLSDYFHLSFPANDRGQCDCDLWCWVLQ
jgi:hypothetical protein